MKSKHRVWAPLKWYVDPDLAKKGCYSCGVEEAWVVEVAHDGAVPVFKLLYHYRASVTSMDPVEASINKEEFLKP